MSDADTDGHGQSKKMAKCPNAYFLLRGHFRRLESVLMEKFVIKMINFLLKQIPGVENDLVKFQLLEWWCKNENIFPLLSKVARFIHAIPATSTPSERMFSQAGNIITEKRSSLKPSKIDSLLFLNSNRDWLQQ